MTKQRLPYYLAAGLFLTLLVAMAYGWWTEEKPTKSQQQASSPALPAQEQKAAFVGGKTCTECHTEQTEQWQGSHHDLAMQEASPKTILGDFNNVEFRKDGIVSRFFQRDGNYYINTDGPDGQMADFQIKYTFGVEPLQQYLVELPGGRLQALSISWDSRPREQGGQRWFHLYPNEKIDYRDELHWTRLSQNWNYMCAECHSTSLEKNYNQADHSYKTTWTDVNVNCESCHGPGSTHVEWARNQASKQNPENGTTPNPTEHRQDTKGLSIQLAKPHYTQLLAENRNPTSETDIHKARHTELEMCARCHSRRGQWFPDYQYGKNLLNTHLPALLQTSLYHPDGQIDGEVYEYGSFLQSRMYKAGVICSDCHEPHSLKLRSSGNGVCLQCHTSEKYETAKHHFHENGSKGSACVDCHMPTRNYMVVDPRHDHSFRIPRPDLTVAKISPNACNNCHSNKSSEWSVKWLEKWYGHAPRGLQNYGETLAAARNGKVGADNELLKLLADPEQPAIARASAAAELAGYLNQESFTALSEALQNPDPLIRVGALTGLQSVPPDQKWQAVHPLLKDSEKVIRALAAETLAGIPENQIPTEQQNAYHKATDEYLQSLRLNADVPGSLVNLGNFNAAKGETQAAETAYRQALELDPHWLPAYVNLADFYRETNRDAEGDAVLQKGLGQNPDNAMLLYDLGLLEIRRKNIGTALQYLKRAVDLAPDQSHYRYVYAIALNSTGHQGTASAEVKKGLLRNPDDRELNELKKQLTEQKGK